MVFSGLIIPFILALSFNLCSRFQPFSVYSLISFLLLFFPLNYLTNKQRRMCVDFNFTSLFNLINYYLLNAALFNAPHSYFCLFQSINLVPINHSNYMFQYIVNGFPLILVCFPIILEPCLRPVSTINYKTPSPAHP